MSFQIGLSGMRAASKDLNVTGNNIANAGTVGFKRSRAEFADVYASTVLGTGKTQNGSGVLMANVAQLFQQGVINPTDNPLDLAINGNGFFQVSNNGAHSYTRAGFFGLDTQGFITDNYGYNLQGYTVNDKGDLEVGKMGNLRIETHMAEPQKTSEIEQTFNLNSTLDAIDLATNVFDPSDPKTYNNATSTVIYDDQGNPHTMTQYFVKNDANNWDMHVLVNGLSLDGTSTTPTTIGLAFDGTGKLSTITPFGGTAQVVSTDGGKIPLPAWNPSNPNPDYDANAATPGNPGIDNGANGGDIELDISNITQFASPFAVTKVVQDGYSIGELSGIEIDDTGKIFARYTNNQSKVQGQVVLANFANIQGLQPVGKTQWVETQESGPVVLNPGTVGTNGAIQAGALEESNVELSDQLIQLIVAQRNYQANAKTIETQSAITQTIINMR